jgi:hypothetical protein
MSIAVVLLDRGHLFLHMRVHDLYPCTRAIIGEHYSESNGCDVHGSAVYRWALGGGAPLS